ncbi:hypothetical protein LMH63_12715 [Spiribacter halobius]|uniref:hypothetical protein n=1 Tax=Sediminicurvatus halobius TaxID=2182432 RepID=UPI001E3EF371|nr:hypothetical protein [Spiribacter halobius]UEX76817.1 hypothetical protein LMH63_12715 [Spiribacter halobius]
MIRTTSARVAIAVATANGMQVPGWVDEALAAARSGKPDNTAAIWHGLDCGRVLAAVDRCLPHVRSWLLLTYGADGYASSRALHRVTSELYRQYAETRTIRMRPDRVVLAAAAVISDLRQQYRSPTREGGEADPVHEGDRRGRGSVAGLQAGGGGDDPHRR